MDENRLKRMLALAKKIAKDNDELELLIDAQLFQVSQTGAGVGIAEQMRMASDHIKKAIYCLALAEADAEGEEITGQMQMDIQRIQDAQEE